MASQAATEALPRPLLAGWFAAECTDADVLVWFRRFLALKVAAPYVTDPLSFVGLASVVIAAGMRKHYWPGLAIIFGMSASEVYQTWPFSLNHIALETMVLLLLTLSPQASLGRIKVLMASVWVYSGLQKIFQGYFASGEFFLLETWSNEGKLGARLGSALGALERLVGAPPHPPLQCCVAGPIPLPAWEAHLFHSLALLTIAAEILLPLTLFFPRTRRPGIVLLFLFQLTIGYLSGEIDFAFSATAMLLLFEPRWARWGYPALAVGFLTVAPWRG